MANGCFGSVSDDVFFSDFLSEHVPGHLRVRQYRVENGMVIV